MTRNFVKNYLSNVHYHNLGSSLGNNGNTNVTNNLKGRNNGNNIE
jgi:hypothetical protein